MGLGHHIGDQPPGVAGLERLGIMHQKAHARMGGLGGAQRADAMAGAQPASFTAFSLGAATCQKRPRTARLAFGTQARYGVGEDGGVGGRGRRHGRYCRRPLQSRKFKRLWRGQRGLAATGCWAVWSAWGQISQSLSASSANSGTSARRLSHTPPPSSVKPWASPRRYKAARWRNRRGSVSVSSMMSRS